MKKTINNYLTLASFPMFSVGALASVCNVVSKMSLVNSSGDLSASFTETGKTLLFQEWASRAARAKAILATVGVIIGLAVSGGFIKSVDSTKTGIINDAKNVAEAWIELIKWIIKHKIILKKSYPIQQVFSLFCY